MHGDVHKDGGVGVCVVAGAGSLWGPSANALGVEGGGVHAVGGVGQGEHEWVWAGV